MANNQKKKFALSAKVVIRNEQGQCLFLKRSQTSANNAGKWDLPGGKIDRGESFDKGLLREVEEETALKISLDRVAGCAEVQLPDRKVAYLIFEGHIESGALRLSNEHDGHDWIELKNLKTLRNLCPQFRDFVKDYAGRQLGYC